MARRFTKVLEEEIEEAFFYPSDFVNTKTTIPLRVGEDASRLGIYPPLFTSPSGDSCILFSKDTKCTNHITVTSWFDFCYFGFGVNNRLPVNRPTSYHSFSTVLDKFSTNCD